MEHATPLMPTAALPVQDASVMPHLSSQPLPLISDCHFYDPQSSQPASLTHAQDRDTLHDTDVGAIIYIDPPLIPLPPSPDGLISWEKFPSLQQTFPFCR